MPYCRVLPSTSRSSVEAGAGTLKLSLAQAPKSMFLQRSLQKGRAELEGAYRLSLPQPGQRTQRTMASSAGRLVPWSCLVATVMLSANSRTQRQLKSAVFVAVV